MPKIKTHQASAKRIKITGGRKRKLMSRRATQGHFNAREDGETMRGKRRDHEVSGANTKTIGVLLPYAKSRKLNK